MTKEGAFRKGTQPHRPDGGLFFSSVTLSENAFLEIPPLAKLRFLSANPHSDPESQRSRTLRAVTEALSLSKEKRTDSGIVIVATGEHLTSDGFLKPPQSPFDYANLYVGFPLDGEKRDFVSARSRDFPGEQDNIYDIVNSLARAGLISIRKERILEIYTRHLEKVRDVDEAIKENPDPTLQALKLKYLFDYLNSSESLYKHLQRRNQLRKVVVGDEEVTVEMRSIEIKLNHKLTIARIKRHSDKYYPTSLDLEPLLQSYRKFLDDPLHASSEAAQRVGICRELGISLPDDPDDTIPDQEQVRDVVVLSSDSNPVQEAKIELTEQSSMRKALTNKKRRQSRRGATSGPDFSTRVTDPADLSAYFGDTGDTAAKPVADVLPARTIGRNVPREGNEGSVPAQTPEKERIDEVGIIRAFLEATTFTRKNTETYLICLSNSHMLYLPVQGRLLSASREDLVTPEKSLSYWEEKVTAVDSDQHGEIYNWLRTELARVEALIATERKSETTLRGISGSSPIKEQALQAKGDRLEELTSTKKVLLLSYLQTAEELKRRTPFMPQPWIPLISSRTQMRLAARPLSEGQIDEASPGIEVTAPLINHYQRQRRSPDDMDVQLTALLTEGQTAYRRQQEGDFAQLTLEEKLQRIMNRGAIQERAKTSLKDRVLVIREAITSPDERARLGITLIALAPLTGKGELSIEDPELSQYEVYMLVPVPGRDTNMYLYCDRTLLAKASDTPDTATATELQELDRLVVNNAELWDEGSVQRYNRQIKELDLFAIREQKGTLTQKQRVQRLPLLVSFIQSSDQLLEYLSGEGYDERFGEIFTWEETDQGGLLSLYSIGDRNLDKILSREAVSSELYLRHKDPIQVPIHYQEILEKKRLCEQGNSSAENKAAAFLCKWLGIDDQ